MFLTDYFLASGAFSVYPLDSVHDYQELDSCDPLHEQKLSKAKSEWIKTDLLSLTF